jgi:hypothetical protein
LTHGAVPCFATGSNDDVSVYSEVDDDAEETDDANEEEAEEEKKEHDECVEAEEGRTNRPRSPCPAPTF